MELHIKTRNDNDPRKIAEHILSQCPDEVKDALYRSVKFDRVRADIVTRLEDTGMEPLTEDQINQAAERYAYHNCRDCNASYWENIDSIIQFVRDTCTPGKDTASSDDEPEKEPMEMVIRYQSNPKGAILTGLQIACEDGSLIPVTWDVADHTCDTDGFSLLRCRRVRRPDGTLLFHEAFRYTKPVSASWDSHGASAASDDSIAWVKITDLDGWDEEHYLLYPGPVVQIPLEKIS